MSFVKKAAASIVMSVGVCMGTSFYTIDADLPENVTDMKISDLAQAYALDKLYFYWSQLQPEYGMQLRMTIKQASQLSERLQKAMKIRKKVHPEELDPHYKGPL